MIGALALAHAASNLAPRAALPRVCLSTGALDAVRATLSAAIGGGGSGTLGQAGGPAGTPDAQLLAHEITEELDARCSAAGPAAADGAAWRLGWRGEAAKPLVLAAFAPASASGELPARLARFRASLLRALDPSADADACAGARQASGAPAAVVRCGRHALLVDGRRFGRDAAPLASELARLLGGEGADGGAARGVAADLSRLRASVAATFAGHERDGRGAAPAESGRLGAPQPVVVLSHAERVDALQLEPLIHALGEGGTLHAAPPPSWRSWARGAEGSAQRSAYDALAAALPALSATGERVPVSHAAFVLLVGSGGGRCASSPADAEEEEEDGQRGGRALGGAPAPGSGDEAEVLRGQLAELLRCRHRTHGALPHVLARRVDHLFSV